MYLPVVDTGARAGHGHHVVHTRAVVQTGVRHVAWGD